VLSSSTTSLPIDRKSRPPQASMEASSTSAPAVYAEASGRWQIPASAAGPGVRPGHTIFRDMCEPAQSGVALFWPVSSAGIRLPYAFYAAVIVALGLVGLVRQQRRR